MNRETFLTELRQRLSGLPREELEERLAFYGEMLDDRLEDGLTEEEAAESLGTPEEVARCKSSFTGMYLKPLLKS